MAAVRELDIEAVRRLLAEMDPEVEIEHHATCTSTNNLLRDVLAKGGGDGLVIVADHQTVGRGRHRRQWESAPGANLLFSMGMRWPRSGFSPTWLMPAAAVAVRDALETPLPTPPMIKWPNDVVLPLGDRALKLAGILAELEGRGPDWAAAVGVGINVNQAWTDSEREPGRPRGSIAMARGSEVEREPILADVITRLRAAFRQLSRCGSTAILESVRTHLWGLGRSTRISVAGNEWTGTPIGVDDMGRLIVESEDGDRRVVTAGDVIPEGGETA